ncbi:hypothetical protein GH714_026178 [Hevea brasiliensis]|uniref:Glucose-6-phosphate isomerase n=1 Tax=Hevea brasiliensis TaxID=3981 RepID=A0A6A6KSV2_HEVBR|nr:hypothetical protein GH714_026178 [Hevea brasiliensis]
MASLSGLCSSSPSLKPKTPLLKTTINSRPLRTSLTFATRYRLEPIQSVAREISTGLSKTNDKLLSKPKQGLEKDPSALWRRYVDWLYQHKELGLCLDVSRIGFTDEFVAEMEPRLQKAFKDMEKLEKGAIANPDEGRMVGHYWLRNSSLAPNSFLKTQIDQTLDAVCKFADEVVSGKIKPPSSPEGRFTQILSVGIGGSALGPQFVAEALAPDNPPLKIRFIDNTDPAGIDHQIAQLGPELSSTLVIVISKFQFFAEWSTPELEMVCWKYRSPFVKGVAITQENSLLDNTARIEGWLARFPMFDWVGGRTSEMSAVGLLPAALQGIDIREMLAGASSMDEANRTTVLRNNPAAMLACAGTGPLMGWDPRTWLSFRTRTACYYLVGIYSNWSWNHLGRNLTWMVNQGLTVYGNKGSTDQHAYIQQLREGVHNFFVTFIEVLRDRPLVMIGNLNPVSHVGTRSALYANDRESITVTVQEVTPRSVGALVALYERAVGIYASLININAYHQPGVEAGKKAAGEVLALQKRVLAVLNEASCKEPVEPLTLEEVAERCHEEEDIEMIYKIIAHMAANDRALIAEVITVAIAELSSLNLCIDHSYSDVKSTMFTEGLDSNAVRWVRENQKEATLSRSSLRPRIGPITNIRAGSRGFGLPPPSKFRSGHLPSTAIPVSRTIPGDIGDSRSASDNDITTESDEDDVYGGRYSLDSSPRDERIPNSTAIGQRYGNAELRGARYATDYVYSDVSSSMETVAGRGGSVAERVVRGNGRYEVGRNGYTEDDYESSDSAASSEFSTTQAGSVSSALPRSRLRVSEGYASSVPSLANVERNARKDLNSRNLQNVKFSYDDDVPSAPPFCGSGQEIKESAELASGVHKTTGITDPCGFPTNDDKNEIKPTSGAEPKESFGNENPDQFVRTTAGAEAAVPSGSNPARLPTFHASALGPWHAVIAYDGCVRLCLHAWARGCMEAPMFLENECALLREAFGMCFCNQRRNYWQSALLSLLMRGLLQNLRNHWKDEVRKVKTVLDPPTGCSMSSLTLRVPNLKLESVRYRFSKLRSTLSTAWQAFRKIHVAPRMPANGSFSRQSLAYVHASTRNILMLVKTEKFSREDAIRMQPGSGETHVFFPDSLGDDLIVEVQDSKGKYYGRVLAQVATIADDPVDKLRWWSIYREPEHELVGKLQLYINYSTSSDDSNLKCGSVAETVAYDLVLEIAMKVQHFQQRNLLLYGSWKWLLTEFASYYGVSDVYTKLRYLSYIMDVATPTADCLTLVYDLLMPVIMKGHSKSTLSHQENRLLGEIKDQIEQILSLAFENYKSLDESSFSGIMDVFKPAAGFAAAALEPAVKLYTLLHDILSPEAQTNLTHYFQAAAKKRSRRHLTETDEFVSNNNEATLMDSVAMSTAYQKMTNLCLNIKNEIFTDIEIHNQHILPSFIDLPNLSSSIYSTELCNRLRAFLLAWPPSGPSPPVAELVIATADFQKDLASWKISPVKGGVDAKELFHLYIMLWIQDKRLSLLESCKLDKVKWSGVRTQHSTTPFVDEMYDRLRETLENYEVIICRWPEYIFVLENAIADVEKAIVEALDKQYADVLAPLKENLTPKKFGFKYVKKLTQRSVSSYTIPDEIEIQFKSWGSCIPDGGNTAPGERLSEVTVMLRAKFRGYLQAVVEKLAENTKLQNTTKLKKILQESKESVVESDIRVRMQPLKDHLTNTINHLQSVFETHVFIAICRGYWDRMGQDVLNFLENRKENRSWYKGSRIAVSVLDDTFASQMQQLLGNALQEKDLEPPRSIMEVRSMLCKDAPNHKENSYYY